jgi:ketosteroid isomerase-like protein
MNAADSKKKDLFETKARALVKKIQSLYNDGKLQELSGMFSDNFVILLGKGKKLYEGSQGIQEFWSQAQARGIKNLELTVDQVFITSADLLISAKADYRKYDMMAYVLGHYKFEIVKKGGGSLDPEGTFIMVDAHYLPCDPDPFGLYFDW